MKQMELDIGTFEKAEVLGSKYVVFHTREHGEIYLQRDQLVDLTLKMIMLCESLGFCLPSVANAPLCVDDHDGRLYYLHITGYTSSRRNAVISTMRRLRDGLSIRGANDALKTTNKTSETYVFGEYPTYEDALAVARHLVNAGATVEITNNCM